MPPPSDQNRGEVAVIDMGPTYGDQFFYSLETNKVLTHNSHYAYDLMFDCDADKFHIWLNSSKFMCVLRTGKTDMDSVKITDTLAFAGWHYEYGAYNPDSSAIGNWWSSFSMQPVSAGQIYLIQLGVNDEGNSLGYVKMKINDFTGSSYSITYSDFVNPAQTVLVSKDGTRNYRYLAFSTGALLDNIEPPKTDWDFCFTRYSVFFYAPYNIPYSVTGVLNNPSKVQAYVDSIILFDSIKIADFNNGRLLNRRDAIGYEWKRYSSMDQNGDYSINFHYTYYVKSGDDLFYKLRFFSFEKNGVRGYPSFEYYRL